jgi:phosphoribosylcarboxyaminoimidazole (NCAIR) mutase
MVVAGIFLKANEARIFTLSGSRENHSQVANKFNKLSLPKNPTQEDVEVFSQTLKAHCTDNKVDKLIINRRATSGQGAGGAGTFILEGVILAKSPAPVIFVHPLTLKATTKREFAKKINRPSTVDLGLAYDIAYEGLE